MTQIQAEGTAMPLVSIVIPSYNCQQYIAATLDSVLAQSHPLIEVLVVDDGSTDRTPDIIAGYGAPVRLIRQHNQRVCRARNHGFEQSKGEFVCFLDHDDHWFPWKLSRQLECFGAHPDSGVVYTAFELWNSEHGHYPDPATLAPDDSNAPAIDPNYSGWIYHQFLLDCWALTSTAMIRRDVFAASGGFDTSLPYSEDWDLWLRLSRVHQFIKVDRKSTLYRQHPEQGSRAVRPIDYRTRLLENARGQWGLTSHDGRSVAAKVFERNLARYHMQFGLQHIAQGSRAMAVRSFLRAWRCHPARLKYAGLASAAMLGWTSHTTD